MKYFPSIGYIRHFAFNPNHRYEVLNIVGSEILISQVIHPHICKSAGNISNIFLNCSTSACKSDWTMPPHIMWWELAFQPRISCQFLSHGITLDSAACTRLVGSPRMVNKLNIVQWAPRNHHLIMLPEHQQFHLCYKGNESNVIAKKLTGLLRLRKSKQAYLFVQSHNIVLERRLPWGAYLWIYWRELSMQLWHARGGHARCWMHLKVLLVIVCFLIRLSETRWGLWSERWKDTCLDVRWPPSLFGCSFIRSLHVLYP